MAAPCKVSIDHGVLIAVIECATIRDAYHISDIRQRILDEFPEATHGILVDCRNLSQFVTSQFLGMLVALKKKAESEGQDMGLCCVGGRLLEVIKISSLDKLLDMYPSRTEAMMEMADLSVFEKASADIRRSRDSEEQARRKTSLKLKRFFAASSSSTLVAIGAGMASMVLMVCVVYSTLFQERKQPPWLKLENVSAKGSFTSTMQGLIEYDLSNGERTADNGARVVTWQQDWTPKEGRLNLTNRLAAKTSKDEVVQVSTTNEEGEFSLDLLGIGLGQSYYVLVISRNQKRVGPIRPHERVELERIFDNVDEAIGDRAYTLLLSAVFKGEPGKLTWRFERNVSALAR